MEDLGRQMNIVGGPLEFPLPKNVGLLVHPKVMPEKTPEKTPEKILALLVLNPKLTISELAQQINRSNSAIERAIRKLQKFGRLKRIGPDKGGHWQVVGEDDG